MQPTSDEVRTSGVFDFYKSLNSASLLLSINGCNILASVQSKENHGASYPTGITKPKSLAIRGQAVSHVGASAQNSWPPRTRTLGDTAGQHCLALNFAYITLSHIILYTHFVKQPNRIILNFFCPCSCGCSFYSSHYSFFFFILCCLFTCCSYCLWVLCVRRHFFVSVSFPKKLTAMLK